MGSAASQDIPYNEVFIYVPNKLLITVDRAKASPIGYIFNNHESFFKATEDRDFKRLLLFFMFEKQKNEHSFWHPYFNAVEPGLIPCFWEDKILSKIDDQELKAQLLEYRESMEEEWLEMEKILSLYSPDVFDLAVCTKDLYLWCSTFISTRCFGWGLPTTIIAPLIDSLNHVYSSANQVDFVNRRLHLQQNKIYAHHFNFEADQAAGESEYNMGQSKLTFNVQRLYAEDVEVKESVELMQVVQGKALNVEEEKQLYEEEEVYQRFLSLMQSEVNNQDEYESEEHKKQKFPDHGMELWGIGYVSSDYEEDNDTDGEEEGADDCLYNEELRDKIMSTVQNPDDLEMDEFDTISTTTRLREIYNYRWWKDEDEDNYLVVVNKHRRTLKAGEQVFTNYGKRTNAHLLENYGFVQEGENKYDSLRFRVILGINPKEQIQLASDLLPTKSILDDRVNIDTTTETLTLKPHRVSDSLFGYLRTVLQNNYQGGDSEYIMVSSPRLLDFELMVIEYAIDLLEAYGKHELYKNSTKEQDKQAMNKETDYRMRFVVKYNIKRKEIYEEHMKLLKVLKAILERLQVNQDSITRATLQKVEGIEDMDSDQVIFKRRMGMRNYFKEFKMNLQRIKKAKMERAKGKVPKEEKKKAAKPKDNQKSPDKSQISTTSTAAQSIKSTATSSKGTMGAKKKKK